MPRISKKANLVKELEAIIKSHTIKAYLQRSLDAEDMFEYELDVLVKLAILKSVQYDFQSSYRTWNRNWEWMLYDGAYMTDDEFLSNFRMDRACIHQLNELVKMMKPSAIVEGSRTCGQQCCTSWCFSNT